MTTEQMTPAEIAQEIYDAMDDHGILQAGQAIQWTRNPRLHGVTKGYLVAEDISAECAYELDLLCASPTDDPPSLDGPRFRR